MRRTRILVLFAVAAFAIPMAKAAATTNNGGVFVNYLWPAGDSNSRRTLFPEGLMQVEAFFDQTTEGISVPSRPMDERAGGH
jgi:hypothetical protein